MNRQEKINQIKKKITDLKKELENLYEFKCYTCNLKFETQKKLLDHNKSKKHKLKLDDNSVFKCPYCNEIFTNTPYAEVDEQDRRINSIHKRAQWLTRIHRKGKPSKFGQHMNSGACSNKRRCGVCCNKIFDNVMGLCRHKKTEKHLKLLSLI